MCFYLIVILKNNFVDFGAWCEKYIVIEVRLELGKFIIQPCNKWCLQFCEGIEVQLLMFLCLFICFL
jgi:hypothetical protein